MSARLGSISGAFFSAAKAGSRRPSLRSAVPRLCQPSAEAHVDLDGLGEALGGVLKLAQQGVHAPQVRPCARVVGSELTGAHAGLQGRATRARCSVDQAQVAVRLGVAGGRRDALGTQPQRGAGAVLGQRLAQRLHEPRR